MIYSIIKKISKSSLLCATVVFSVAMSLAITSVMSLYFHDAITTDFIITGLVTSFIVATLVLYVVLGLEKEITLSENALRASNKKMLSWLENSPVCTKIVDSDFKFQYMSTAGIKCLRIKDITDFYGKPFPLDCYPEPSRNLITESLEKVRRTGEAENIKASAYDMDGKEWWFDTTFVPVNDDNDQLEYIMVVSFNITEQIELESRLRHVQKMEALGTMAGGIAHDFNNILTIIAGNADLALYTIEDEHPAKQNIDRVLNASKRASGLINQILTFSRKNATSNKIPVSPQGLMKETMELIRSTTPTTVSIKQRVSQDCSKILIDPSQFNQLLMNIFSNAVDAINEHGEIAVNLQEEYITSNDHKRFLSAIDNSPIIPGKYIILSITDNGIGIDGKIIERIFDPFYTTKDVGRGTGMGLSVVHSIVLNHDSFITVESEVDNGSTFKVFFPVIDEEKILESEDEEKILESEDDIDLQIGTEKILLIDDEEDILKFTKNALKQLGYEVESDDNGSNALAHFKSDPSKFDLIVTDQSMPNMSGLEFISEVLKIRPDMPIILCSGYSTKVSAENAADKGISKYIEKPYSKEILSGAIRDVLDKQV